MTYWGESHRSWHDRSEEHIKALKSGNQGNALVKHQTLHHPDETPNFQFKLHKSWKTSLQRQIQEGLLIQNTDTDLLMNSRSEWGNNGIPRIVIQDTRHQTTVEKGLPTKHQPQITTDTRTHPPPVDLLGATKKRQRLGADSEDSGTKGAKPPNHVSFSNSILLYVSKRTE